MGVRELLRRKMVRAQHVPTIKQQQIAIGMSECEVIAAWGWPTDQNESHHQWGVTNQMIFGTYSQYSKPKYVYTEDRIVTSWQE